MCIDQYSMLKMSHGKFSGVHYHHTRFQGTNFQWANRYANRTCFAEIVGNNVKTTMNINVYYSQSLHWRTRGNLLLEILYVSFDFYSNRVSVFFHNCTCFSRVSRTGCKLRDKCYYVSISCYNSQLLYWESAWKQVQMEFWVNETTIFNN